MKTKPKKGWRFWRSGKLDRDEYSKDLDRIIAKYNEKGFYDAEVLSDSVYIVDEDSRKPYLKIEIEVREGAQYHIRNIEWDGNTLFPDEVLTQRLGFLPGATFNSKQLQ